MGKAKLTSNVLVIRGYKTSKRRDFEKLGGSDRRSPIKVEDKRGIRNWAAISGKISIGGRRALVNLS